MTPARPEGASGADARRAAWRGQPDAAAAQEASAHVGWLFAVLGAALRDGGGARSVRGVGAAAAARPTAPGRRAAPRQKGVRPPRRWLAPAAASAPRRGGSGALLLPLPRRAGGTRRGDPRRAHQGAEHIGFYVKRGGSVLAWRGRREVSIQATRSSSRTPAPRRGISWILERRRGLPGERLLPERSCRGADRAWPGGPPPPEHGARRHARHRAHLRAVLLGGDRGRAAPGRARGSPGAPPAPPGCDVDALTAEKVAASP